MNIIVLVCVMAHTKGVMTSLSLHRSSILRKNEKSKMEFWGEKKLKLPCTYFSVGRYSTECCYYSLYPLFEGGGWTTWNTQQKMISERELTFQGNHSVCAWFQDWSTANKRTLFPFRASHASLLFCISGLSYQALTMQNSFHILPIAWLFRGRCPWENKLSAGVCISKSFLIFFPCSHWPVEQCS